jgi:hypothetical protein
MVGTILAFAAVAFALAAVAMLAGGLSGMRKPAPVPVPAAASAPLPGALNRTGLAVQPEDPPRPAAEAPKSP